jgi:hypothetical protein
MHRRCDIPTREVDFKDGEYRWRYGLHIRAAWKILDRRRLEEISSRDFHMDAALGIVPLTEQETAAIRDLAQEPVGLRWNNTFLGNLTNSAIEQTAR